MILIQKRRVGQDYFSKKLCELASIRNVQIDSLDWNDPPSQSYSEIILAKDDKKKTYRIDNLELESINFRTELDRKAECIMADLH